MIELESVSTALVLIDLQKGILANASTQIGVESTARQAYEHGYELLILKDATASSVAEGHEMSMKYILPRLSRLVRSDDIWTWHGSSW